MTPAPSVSFNPTVKVKGTFISIPAIPNIPAAISSIPGFQTQLSTVKSQFNLLSSDCSSLQSTLNNITASVQGLPNQFTGPLGQQLTTLLNQLNGMTAPLQALASSWTPVGTALQMDAVDAAQDIVKIAKGQINGVADLIRLAGSLWGDVKNIAEKLAVAEGAILFNQVGALQNAISDVNTWFVTDAVGDYQKVTGALQTISADISAIQNQLSGVMSTLTTLVQSMGTFAASDLNFNDLSALLTNVESFFAKKQLVGIAEEIDLILDETDTQWLQTFLANYDESTPKQAILNTLIGIATSEISGAVSAGLSGGPTAIAAALANPQGYVSAIIKLAFALQAQLVAKVITVADNNHNGITLHFSLIADAAVAALVLTNNAGVATAFVAAEEITLNAELQKPGGTGGSLVDMFWITGNAAA